MRAIVVGGGIVGLASAHYLRQRGVEVTLLEKDSLGAGATDRAAGGIRAQFESPVSIALSLASMAVWERFAGTFGTDIAYRRPGYLFLARSDSTAGELRANVAVQNDHGVPSEFVTPDEAADRCPGIYPDRYVGAAYSPTDGYADPHLALQGFAEAAAADGADVRTGVEVVDVARNAGGRVTGVETTAGEMAADYVVNAAGAWAGRVAAMAGVDVPITPHRRQVIVVDPERPLGDAVPMTFDYDRSTYFRPERDGAALVGGHFSEREDEPADPDGYDENPRFDLAATAMDRAADVADYFGPETEMRRGWAGLYAVTPDYHPVLEETAPGFVNAVGFSGHGFMQAPAAGRVVAELVVDGDASVVDVSALANDRFERGALLPDAHGERYG